MRKHVKLYHRSIIQLSYGLRVSILGSTMSVKHTGGFYTPKLDSNTHIESSLSIAIRRALGLSSQKLRDLRLSYRSS